MRNKLLVFICLLFTTLAFGQKPAYRIYNSKGKKVSYDRMLKKMASKDLVLFGEQHNNAIAHWLEYELMVDLHKTRSLILGAEMIEADNQDELNDYLSGKIDQSAFDTLARLWPNYDTDYAPLIDYAKANAIPVVASNIPRRYAKMVYRQGFEVLERLTDEEKSWMVPLPMAFDPELQTYKEILEMMGDHGTPELVMAQSVKDATMAHFIVENLETKHLFLHYNGAFHSDKYEGILWYVRLAKKDINVATISTVSQENINKLLEENKQLADYIICVDSDMTTTY